MLEMKKIGLYVIPTLFAFAVGHTIYNKINVNKNNTAVADLSKIQEALDAQSESDTAFFKAQQILEDINKKINNDNDISQRDLDEQYDIEHNCVECGD